MISFYTKPVGLRSLNLVTLPVDVAGVGEEQRVIDARGHVLEYRGLAAAVRR